LPLGEHIRGEEAKQKTPKKRGPKMSYKILLKKWRGQTVRWIQADPGRPVFSVGALAIGKYKLYRREVR